MAFTFRNIAGAGQNKTAGTAATITALSCAVGDLVLVNVVCDSISGGGAIGTNAVTDDDGNTYTRVASYDPNASATLPAVALFYSVLTTVTGGNILVTFTPSASSAAKVVNAQSWIPAGTVSLVSGTANTASGSSTTPSVSNLGTLQTDDLVVGMYGLEAPNETIADFDTLNGSWDSASPGWTSGGSALTNVCVILQAKSITAPGTQTYNATIATSRDWGAVICAFRDTVAATKPPNPARRYSSRPFVNRRATFGGN